MYGCQLWSSIYQYSYRKLHVAYNDGFRQLLHEPRWCSTSQLFVANDVPSFDANIRKLVYSLWRLLNVSDNVLVRTALCSDLFAISLVGLTQRELDRVQSVVNAAARLSADARKYDHVTPLLIDLHWLRVPERVKFKLCVLMHRCLTGAAPRYLTELAVPVDCSSS